MLFKNIISLFNISCKDKREFFINLEKYNVTANKNTHQPFPSYSRTKKEPNIIVSVTKHTSYEKPETNIFSRNKEKVV